MAHQAPATGHRRPAQFGAIALAVALVAGLAGCEAPTVPPLTAADKEDLCSSLYDTVVVTAASAVYAPISLFRRYGPTLPGGTSLPYPDCAYLARSEHTERTEVFYLGIDETELARIEGALESSAYVPDGESLWRSMRRAGAVARIEQFWSVRDASDDVRAYAALLNRPAIVVTIIAPTQDRRNSSGASR
jgi:hypothetical protein